MMHIWYACIRGEPHFTPFSLLVESKIRKIYLDNYNRTQHFYAIVIFTFEQ